MNQISVTEAAHKLGISTQRIRKLLSEGRIVGAKKVGAVWVLPADVKVLSPGKALSRT